MSKGNIQIEHAHHYRSKKKYHLPIDDEEEDCIFFIFYFWLSRRSMLMILMKKTTTTTTKIKLKPNETNKKNGEKKTASSFLFEWRKTNKHQINIITSFNFFLFFFSFPPNFFDIFIIYKNKEKILSLSCYRMMNLLAWKRSVFGFGTWFLCVCGVCWNIYFIIIIVPCLDPVDLKIIVFEEFNLVRRHEMNENENITRFGQK